MIAGGKTNRFRAPRRAGCAVALATVLAIVAGGTAMARVTSHPTAVVYVSGSESGTRAQYMGYLTSPKRRCLSNRTVKLVIHRPNGTTKVIDVDHSSANGAWHGGGDIAGADSAKAKVTKKRFGPRLHRHVCRAASTSIPVTFS